MRVFTTFGRQVLSCCSGSSRGWFQFLFRVSPPSQQVNSISPAQPLILSHFVARLKINLVPNTMSGENARFSKYQETGNGWRHPEFEYFCPSVAKTCLRALAKTNHRRFRPERGIKRTSENMGKNSTFVTLLERM